MASEATDLPQTMKAIVCTAIGQPKDVLKMKEDIPVPKIDKPDRVLVKILYAAINPVDYKIVTGIMGPLSAKKPPHITGFDFAGILLKKGSDPELKYRIEIGDLVYGQVHNPENGSFAEYTVCDGKRVHRAPSSITALEAASLPMVSQTSYQAIIKMGLKKKDKILILGGSTATGLMAIQIAKYFIECSEVIVTSSSEQLCKSVGADKVINYQTSKWWQVLKDYNFDGVYDCIGGIESWNECRTANVLKKDGHFVTIVGDNKDEKQDLGKLIQFGFSLMNRKFWGKIGTDRKYEIFLQNSAKNLRDITSLIDGHKIRAVIDEESPFEMCEYMKMFEKCMAHKAKGKLVMKVASDYCGEAKEESKEEKETVNNNVSSDKKPEIKTNENDTAKDTTEEQNNSDKKEEITKEVSNDESVKDKGNEEMDQ